jgi:nucleotide-binding universal stress UspA family protein
MQQIRSILVPVDFSESSRRALEYASVLGGPVKAKIDVLHVWQVPSFLPPDAIVSAADRTLELVKLVQENADKELLRFASRAREDGIAIATTRSEPGIPSGTIVEIAKNGAYDLIVMGTHGRTGLSRALLGSVAERVVRSAPCAVLTVPLKEEA